MAEKVLFQTELNQLATTDLETTGSERRNQNGELYRWIKNKGTTAVVQGSPLLNVVTSIAANLGKLVIAPDGAGASTASVNNVAGLAMTGIGASGASTGDHGWVLVKGYTSTAYVYQAVTALTVGMHLVVTSVIAGVTYAFDKPQPATFSKQGVLMSAVATTGAATAANAVVRVDFS